MGKSSPELSDRVGRYIDDTHTGRCEGMARVIAAWAGGCSIDAVVSECMRTHPGVADELSKRGWTATKDGLERSRKCRPATKHTAPTLKIEVAPKVPREPKPRAARAPVVFMGTRDRGAAYSPCRKYRYACWNTWARTSLGAGGGILVVIGHNPSVADHERPDPTFSRGIRFAHRWGYAGVCFINPCAYISTDPKALKSADSPFGPSNGHVWSAALRWGHTFLASWGNHQPVLGRYVTKFCEQASRRGVKLMCMGTTSGGHPKHLLARGKHRISDDQEMVEWIP